MHRYISAALSLAATLILPGCISLQPDLPEAETGIAGSWTGPGAADSTAVTEAADVGWREFFTDPELVALVDRALQDNRSLRATVLGVERARALYGIQRADTFPSVYAGGNLNRRGGDGQAEVELYTAELGLAAYEVDLFGRVNSLSEAALNRYLASEQARQAVHISLVAEVAGAYLTLAADRELLALTQSTLSLYEEELALTQRRYDLGAVSPLDLNQARTLVANARANIALYEGRVAQDISALNLLAGGIVGEEKLPESFSSVTSGVPPLPSGLPSTALLRRPDIRQAEHQLLAANANIGAARAAFFPSITLTGTYGTASVELDDLFKSGTEVWSFMPRVTVPIFQGGRLRANRDLAYADRDIALAGYELAIQRGFKEVSDGLVLNRTLADRRQALEELVNAAQETLTLSQQRYNAGRDSYLVLLDAQRTLYSARQALIVSQLSEQVNRINLYKALGGGWKDRS